MAIFRARTARPRAVNGSDTATETSAEERYFIASQRQLMWRKFKKHRVAVISGIILVLAYLAAFGYEFCAPYGPADPARGVCERAADAHPPDRPRRPPARPIRVRAHRQGKHGNLPARVRRGHRGDASVALVHARRGVPLLGQRRRQPPPVRRRRGAHLPARHRRPGPRRVLARHGRQPHQPDHRPVRRVDQLRARLHPGRCVRLLRRPARPADPGGSSNSSGRSPTFRCGWR